MCVAHNRWTGSQTGAEATVSCYGDIPGPWLIKGRFPTSSDQSLNVSSTVKSVLTYQSITGQSSFLSVESELVVHAETALVVQPIKQSVFTSIIPAVTFQNPDGENIATEDPQTILSATYLTPTPTSAPQQSSNTPPTASSEPTSKSRGVFLSNTDMLAAPSTSLAAVEHITASETSQRIPSFTYSPQEDSAASPAVSTAIPTGETLIQTSGGLPVFTHPGTNLPAASYSSSILGAVPAINSPVIQSTTPTVVPSFAFSLVIESTPAVGSQSSLCPDTPLASVSKIADGNSRVFITETQYTTAYPSPSLIGNAPPSQDEPLKPAAPSEARNTSSVEQSSAVLVLSSPVAPPLSKASLQQTLAVVIVTDYTTVTPGLALESTRAPETYSLPSIPQPAFPTASASPTVPGLPSSSPLPQPAVPSPAPAYSPNSPASQSIALPPIATPPSIQAPQASSSTMTGTPSVAPPAPTPSPTSESPLVVMPIPPSQIFTVTVTTTNTVRETTTVTVTA